MVSRGTACDPKPLPAAGVEGWRLPEAVGLFKSVNMSAVIRSFDESDGYSSPVFSPWIPCPGAGGWKGVEVDALAVFRISDAKELATGSGRMTNSDALAVFGFSDAEELAKGSARMATSSASGVLPLQNASMGSTSVSFI